MSKRAFTLTACIVLVLAALTPLMECFDHWDTKPGPQNDTEIHLTAWFVGVGIVLTLAETLHLVPAPAISKASRRQIAQAPAVPPRALRAVEPTASPPPLTLRI